MTILIAGAAARVATSLGPGSLWFDELATALNVTGRNWGGLLDPLGYGQVAPFGFIVAEKAGVAILGGRELGLRLFPLLVSLVSLLLFWRVASRYLTGASLLAALSLFAVSPAMVWYARKAKQYAGDVGATLLLLWLAQRSREDGFRSREAWIAGILGGAAIMFSHPALLVACGLVTVLAYERWREGRPLRPLLGLTVGWGAASALQLWTTSRLTTHDTKDFMQSAWRFAFLPAPWKSPDAVLWLPLRFADFVGFLVGLLEPDSAWEIGFVGIYFVLAVIGIVRLVRSRERSGALLLVPLAVAILASAARILPFSGRLMIYTGPTVLVACMAGIEEIRERAPGPIGARVRVAGIVLAAVPALFLPFLIPALNERDDTRPVLREMGERWREGDVLYVYHGAAQAMKFYGEPLGIAPWIEGGRHGADERDYLREVDRLRGRPRAWFFHAHAGGCRVPLIHAYLESIGTEIDVVRDPHGNRGMHQAEARLYDLSDSELLARSSAETQALLDRQDPSCRDRDLPIGRRIKRRVRRLLADLAG